MGKYEAFLLLFEPENGWADDATAQAAFEMFEHSAHYEIVKHGPYQGLYESDADFCASLTDAELRIRAQRDGDRLRAARAEAVKRGIQVV